MKLITSLESLTICTISQFFSYVQFAYHHNSSVMFLNQCKNAGAEKDKLSFGLLPNKNAAFKQIKYSSSDCKLSRF